MGSLATQQRPTQTESAPQLEETVVQPRDQQDTLGNEAIQKEIQASVGQQTYEQALGGFLGSKLFDLVSDTLSEDKIQEYAKDAAESATDAVSEWLKGQASPDEAEAAQKFAEALSMELEKAADKLMSDGGVAAAIAGWAEEHPRTILAAVLAGAATYVLTNQKIPDLEKKFGLGGGHALLVGVNIGRTLDIALNQVKLGYRYSGGGMSAQVTGTAEDEDNWGVQGRFDQDLGGGKAWWLSGQHNVDPSGDSSQLNLGYRQEDFQGEIYGRSENRFGDRNSTLGARLSGNNQQGFNWNAGAEASTDGSYRGTGGATYTKDQLELGASAYSGRDANGNKDTGAQLGLKWRF